MNKIKIVLSIVLVVLAIIVAIENWAFFTQKQGLLIHFYFTETYHSPELPNMVWFLACFSIGFLLSHFFSLMERFKSNRTIKEFRAKTESLLDMIAQLRKELELRKAPPASTEPIVEVKPETVPDERPEISQ